MLPNTNINELSPAVQERPSTTCCLGGWLHSVLTPRARRAGKPPAGDYDCPRALPLPRLDAFRSNLLACVNNILGHVCVAVFDLKIRGSMWHFASQWQSVYVQHTHITGEGALTARARQQKRPFPWFVHRGSRRASR